MQWFSPKRCLYFDFVSCNPKTTWSVWPGDMCMSSGLVLFPSFPRSLYFFQFCFVILSLLQPLIVLYFFWRRKWIISKTSSKQTCLKLTKQTACEQSTNERMDGRPTSLKAGDPNPNQTDRAPNRTEPKQDSHRSADSRTHPTEETDECAAIRMILSAGQVEGHRLGSGSRRGPVDKPLLP